jgi:hypothetical protein
MSQKHIWNLATWRNFLSIGLYLYYFQLSDGCNYYTHAVECSIKSTQNFKVEVEMLLQPCEVLSTGWCCALCHKNEKYNKKWIR